MAKPCTWRHPLHQETTGLYLVSRQLQIQASWWPWSSGYSFRWRTTVQQVIIPFFAKKGISIICYITSHVHEAWPGETISERNKVNACMNVRKPQHKSGSLSVNIFYFADYWLRKRLTCLYGLEMTNKTAHFQHFRVQHNRADRRDGVLRQRGRRHLQTACFERPICMDFFAPKISNSVPKCSVHPRIFRSTSTSKKTHSLNDLAG